MKKYVLTGGPGVGKSTVLRILASRGFSVVPEIARELIEDEHKKNSDILPWRNHAKFQNMVARKQYAAEKEIINSVGTFLDRSLVDGYAYCKYANTPIPQIILDGARNRYDKIFLLEQLPIYRKDEHRKENRDLQSTKRQN